ncbi:MAG: hypothetical protein WCN92_05535, partial [Eubacteriales bacterium]
MGKSYTDLYSNYKQNILSLTNGNEFYEHLMDVVEQGKNNLSLFNRYYEKKIDLEWVDAIEKCIIPLDSIVRNPRKFIIQEEEIVPIERAKKITAESVRHLAQHTNMIARVDGDRVTPSEILNVFREESFEIYENRFIFTLLKLLQRFIDTRYDVLFSISDDENMASLKMESDIEKGKEKIIYKLEISSQSSSEALNKDDKEFDSFQRIGRIKKIINEFSHSTFMNELQNCTPVRPPIMRTNVIAKDPNFQACLVLWQFISSYDEVGYEIISRESNDMVSEEYRNDLYRIITMNYLLLKNNTVSFEDATGNLKKRKFKPKMLRRIAEELVMDYDMEEVEIRRIFVDELKRASKKKTEGEERIRQAIEDALAAENARKAAIEEKVQQEIQRQKDIIKRRKEREIARIAREKELEKARKEKEKARLKALREKEIAIAKAKAAREKELVRIAKEKAIEAERIAKDKEKARIQKEKERLAKLKAIEEEKARKAAQLEQQRKARELALALAKKEKEKVARQKEKERLAKIAAEILAKEKAAAAKQREKERIAKEKAEQLAREKAAAAKQKEKERIALEKAEQEALAKAAKQKEKERIAFEKAEQEALEKAAKQKEKERIAHEKA